MNHRNRTIAVLSSIFYNIIPNYSNYTQQFCALFQVTVLTSQFCSTYNLFIVFTSASYNFIATVYYSCLIFYISRSQINTIMATIAEEFVHKFNNLEGLTIAERKKNFFKLLHQTAPLLKNNTEHLEWISSNLTSSSFLEDLFKVDFFIYFRRVSELLQLLKGGNSTIITKLARQNWFFKDAFQSVSAEDLVNEILPCMSYAVRMKVLRKLSRLTNYEKFEQIYDALVSRYGMYLASRFITGCGPDKIRQILTEYPTKLTSNQLRILYGKDPELIDFYFINSTHSLQDHNYKGFINFIFNTNRDYFEYLKLNYDISFQFGRRASKKFVAVNRDAVIAKPHDFDYLDMKAVVRKIGKDSMKLFSNALPAQVGTSLPTSRILNSCPKKYRYRLFFETYQSHYHIKFEDHPELITEMLLNMIPASKNSERAILAKIKVDKGCDEYLKYLLINEAVPLIKEKINLTSDIEKRGRLIKYLLDTCHVNNDLNALSSVLKYFCFRHKNDDLNVHLLFIHNIESIFGFKNFTEEMWTCMNELLLIHALKFDTSDTTYKKIQTLPLLNFNLGTSIEQKLCYLEFLFKKDQSIDELIREYFTTNSAYPSYGKYDAKFERYFLLFVINNLCKQSDEGKCVDFNVLVISEIEKWNDYHKDDPLSFYDFPILLYTFNHVIKNYKQVDNNWSYRQNSVVRLFRNKIFTTEPNIYRDEYLQLYWQRVDDFLTFQDIEWFLKYEPLVIVANFESVFNKLIESMPEAKRSGIWYQIKKFHHLELDTKSIDKGLARLNQDDPNVMKAKYIPCLSVLLQPNDYAVLADSYKPENQKLDLKNENEITLYQLQCAIATQFKNTQSHEVLWSLLNYCVGDYLKSSMPSVYSLLYRTPENMLPPYLNHLSKKAVSVRKHALFLTCELGTSTSVEDMLRFLNEQEAVLSLQKHMFSSTIQYFVKNPTDSFFELVKLNMLFVTKADNESLSSIVSHLSRIPQKYKIRYILHAWQHFEQTVDIWETLKPLKHRLLAGMDEEIVKEIPLEWGLGVIQQHFMTENNDRDVASMPEFMLKFVASTQDRDVIFEKIFTLLDRCKNQHLVFDFLHSWCHTIMRSNRDELRYLDPYVSYFGRKITPVAHFRDYIRVFFLKIRVESSRSLPIDDLALKVLIFFARVSEDYGPHVTHLFAKEMDTNFSYFVVNRSVTKLDIYYSMIKQRPVPSVAVLLLHVMSKPDVNSVSSEIFDNILRQIISTDDAGVQINLQCRFKEYLDTCHWRFSGVMEVDRDHN